LPQSACPASASRSPEPAKFVLGAMKGMLSRQDELALLDAVEGPLPDEIVAAFHGGPLETPDQ
jgi:hypothetical protein